MSMRYRRATESSGNNLNISVPNWTKWRKSAAILQIEGLLDTLIDAKEYGSILSVEEYDWDLLRRFVNSADIGSQISFDTYGLDETAEKLKELIEIGAIMAQKYEVVATNPPYAAVSNLDVKASNFMKKELFRA